MAKYVPLASDGSYRMFLPVAIFFNGLLIICLYVLLEAFGCSQLVPISGMVLVTSPYIISQTMFAWPKDAAGFFILLAYVSVFIYSRPIAAAFLLAGGYYCHPYAITYGLGAFAIISLMIIIDPARFSFHLWLRKLAIPLCAYMATLLPWILWQLFSPGSNSDLVAQNFSAHNSLQEQILTRIANILVVLYYSRAQLFVGHGYIEVYSWSFISALGIGFFPFLLWGLFTRWSRYQFIILAGFVSMGLIIAVFSQPSFIIVHGTQTFTVLCFSISLITALETIGMRVIYGGSLIQIVLNVTVWISKLYFLEV